MTDRVIVSAPSCLRVNANVLFAAALAAPLVFVGSSRAAYAQATLHITVRNIKTQAVVSRALIRLDSPTERSKQQTTDATGLAVFPALSPGTYAIAVSAVNFRTLARDNIVVGDSGVVNVDIALTPSDVIDINKRGLRELLQRGDTSISTRRDASFFQDFPIGAGNGQSVPRELRAIPGIVGDSVNQFHVRGDNTLTTATYLDGFLLPAFAQGAISQFLLPDTIASTRIITGNFAPEFGSGGGGILDLTLRAPQPALALDATVKVGSFGTSEVLANIDNQVSLKPRRNRQSAATTSRGGTINYTVALSQRNTDNALEAPQESGATEQNHGESGVFFSKFDYKLNPRATLTALLNYSSGRSDLTPRDGDSGFGLGYGYGGYFGADSGLQTQKDAGYSFYQKDDNSLALLQLKLLPKGGGTAVVSLASTYSKLFSYNTGSPLNDLINLPTNSSLDYADSNYQDYEQTATQIDYSLPRSNTGHQIKVGAVYHSQKGNEAYYYRAQSQLALDALHALEPRLTPQGGALTGDTDELGNPVYQLQAGADPFTSTPSTPVVYVTRKGHYAGFYAQDTWRVRPNLTVNYGARLENYEQEASEGAIIPATGTSFSGGTLPKIDKTEVSPRFNAAYTLTQTQQGQGRGFRALFRTLFRQPTILRFGYGRLFSQPGLSQGAFIGSQSNDNTNITTTGSPVSPQMTNQFDLSLERQLSTSALLKLSYYNKDITNYLTNQTLLQGEQSGLLAVFNQGDYMANGVEVSFDLLASENNLGPHAYITFANSSIKPKGSSVNNLGQTYQGDYAQSDQRNTFSAGIAYNMAGGASVGLSGYYGSGLYSSAFQPYSVSGTANRSSERDAYSEVNFRIASGPRLFKNRAGVELQVENLFDGNSRLNYQSSFAGTRYQQGRRIFAVLTGRF